MTQLPAAELEKGTPSAHARPEYTYAWERFIDVGREMIPLMRAHWKANSSWRDLVELDVDWDRLLEMEARGALHLLTVRSNGVLVGYMPVVFSRHLMAEFPMAMIDTYVMHPAYQDGWTLVKMLKKVMKRMKEMGARVISVRAPDDHLKPVMHRMGFGMPETTYFKRLDLSDE